MFHDCILFRELPRCGAHVDRLRRNWTGRRTLLLCAETPCMLHGWKDVFECSLRLASLWKARSERNHVAVPFSKSTCYSLPFSHSAAYGKEVGFDSSLLPAEQGALKKTREEHSRIKYNHQWEQYRQTERESNIHEKTSGKGKRNPCVVRQHSSKAHVWGFVNTRNTSAAVAQSRAGTRKERLGL